MYRGYLIKFNSIIAFNFNLLNSLMSANYASFFNQYLSILNIQLNIFLVKLIFKNTSNLITQLIIYLHPGKCNHLHL